MWVQQQSFADFGLMQPENATLLSEKECLTPTSQTLCLYGLHYIQ